MAKLTVTMRAVITLLGSAAYLGLAILGWGGFAPFFSHPPLVGLAVVFLIVAIVAFFAGGSMSPGLREDRANRWVIPAFAIIGLAAGFFAPYTDRLGFWTFDGDAVRWTGVVLTAVGSLLRIIPVYVLGDRFSGLVAIQPGHTLVTTGLYAKVRHPSYLGMLVASIGWALAFRSAVGLLFTLLLLLPLVARMNSEEKLLHDQFGSEYEAYRARTWRLLPHLY